MDTIQIYIVVLYHSNPKNTFLALKSALERAKTGKEGPEESSPANNENCIEAAFTTLNVTGNFQKEVDVKESAKQSTASNELNCSLASDIADPKSDEITCCEPTKKDSSSLFPTMKWYQTKDDVIASFLLGGLRDYKLDLTKNSLIFSAAVSNGSK